MNKLILSGLCLSLISCANLGIKTRGQIATEKKSKELADSVNDLKTSRADYIAQAEDINQELRSLLGQIDVLKTQIAQNEQDKQAYRESINNKVGQLEAKLKLYEVTISALEDQVAHLKATKAKPVKTKGLYDSAMDKFDAKDWKKAILSLQEYVQKYPKGKNAAMATYHIGVAFQELKMKDEAKAFYQETLEKFAKSSAARKAQYRLNQMK